MSKGRNISKRKWRDFRKSNKYRCKTKFPRNRKSMKEFEGTHLSMRCQQTLYDCL